MTHRGAIHDEQGCTVTWEKYGETVRCGCLVTTPDESHDCGAPFPAVTARHARTNANTRTSLDSQGAGDIVVVVSYQRHQWLGNATAKAAAVRPFSGTETPAM